MIHKATIVVRRGGAICPRLNRCLRSNLVVFGSVFLLKFSIVESILILTSYYLNYNNLLGK